MRWQFYHLSVGVTSLLWNSLQTHFLGDKEGHGRGRETPPFYLFLRTVEAMPPVIFSAESLPHGTHLCTRYSIHIIE